MVPGQSEAGGEASPERGGRWAVATKARTLGERIADAERKLAGMRERNELVGREGQWQVRDGLSVPVVVVAVGPKVHGQQLVVVRFAGSTPGVGDGTAQVALRKVALAG